MHPTLNIAVKAALRAGKIINRASLDLGQLTVGVKQQNDFVTEVDKAAETAIIETLRETYPQHAILAEETGQSGHADSEYQWIIDPLDGTTNFIHGFPQYAVSIAMALKGVLTHAVHVVEGVVANYRVQAPTDNYFADATALSSLLANLQFASLDQARRVLNQAVLALDPCVPYVAEVVDA